MVVLLVVISPLLAVVVRLKLFPPRIKLTPVKVATPFTSAMMVVLPFVLFPLTRRETGLVCVAIWKCGKLTMSRMSQYESQSCLEPKITPMLPEPWDLPVHTKYSRVEMAVTL